MVLYIYNKEESMANCACGNNARYVVEWFYHDGGHMEFDVVCSPCMERMQGERRFGEDRPRPEIITGANTSNVREANLAYAKASFPDNWTRAMRALGVK
jgi:hypothetical protein